MWKEVASGAVPSIVSSVMIFGSTPAAPMPLQRRAKTAEILGLYRRASARFSPTERLFIEELRDRIALSLSNCPVDFFRPSEVALSYAVSLAKTHQARLHIIHVIPPMSSFLNFAQDTGKLVKSEHEESQQRLAKTAKDVKRLGINGSVEVRFGEIDHEILNAIGEQEAGLLVAGTHGRRGFEHWLMGSVCERLLRRVPIPILTIGRTKRRAGDRDIKRILIGIDFSEGSAEVVAWAFWLARKSQTVVTLLHVTDFVTGDVPTRYRNSLLEGIRVEMEKFVPGAESHVETRVEFGMPSQVILRLAEREKAGMIVLGTHGKSMLDRTLLGTTAERVIRGAPCPVLAVPPAPAKGLVHQTRRL